MNRKEILELEGRESWIAITDQLSIPKIYPTDMNDAMLVVDKMRERGWRGFHLKWDIRKERFVSAFCNDETFRECVADNPAEAICRSALLALNGE